MPGTSHVWVQLHFNVKLSAEEQANFTQQDFVTKLHN